MTQYYLPYAGKKPVALNINGHRLVILSKDPVLLEDSLEAIGADKVKRIVSGSSREEENQFLNELARKTHAGVVIAPGDTEMSDVIRNLESQLPWLQ